MRHKVFGRKLNRDIKERKALFRSLISAFILHGKIKTTYAKAKAVGSLIEKLVTKAKDGSKASLVQITSVLNNNDSVKKLVNDIAPSFKDKIGGYIRMIRLGKRQGDNAEIIQMEWTVKPEVLAKGQSSIGRKKETAKPIARKPKPEVKKKPLTKTKAKK